MLDCLLPQCLSEPEFYGDLNFCSSRNTLRFFLVQRFRKIIGKNDMPYHFIKVIVRYKKSGKNVDAMQQTACLVANPVKVNCFTFLFDRQVGPQTE